MAGKELLQTENKENKGVVEKYKGFNKLTRNVSLGIAGGAAVVGAGPVALVALGAAGIDQVQIMLIDKWQKRKQGKEGRGVRLNQDNVAHIDQWRRSKQEKESHKQLARSGTIVDLSKKAA